MVTVLEAEAVVAEGVATTPLSFQLRRGQVIGVLVPVGVDCGPLLRVLAARESPVCGVVRIASRSRVALLSPGSSSPSVSLEQLDALLLDELVDVADAVAERSAWARLAATRAQGTAILLATSRVEQAYRCDRVLLAGWSAEAAWKELRAICERMRPLVRELLDSCDERGIGLDSGTNALLRLGQASAALLREGRSRAVTEIERLRLQEVAAELSEVCVDERVLMALTREDPG